MFFNPYLVGESFEDNRFQEGLDVLFFFFFIRDRKGKEKGRKGEKGRERKEGEERKKKLEENNIVR